MVSNATEVIKSFQRGYTLLDSIMVSTDESTTLLYNDSYEMVLFLAIAHCLAQCGLINQQSLIKWVNTRNLIQYSASPYTNLLLQQ